MELAERIYNIALRFDKANHSAQLNLSNLYIKTGRIRKGKSLQNKIKKYMRGNPYYHFNLGKIAYGKGEFYKAIKHYKSAVRRDKTIPEFYIQIGAAYFKLGNKKYAEKYMKKAAKLARSSSEQELYRKKLEYIHVNLKKK
jgi:Flp pilus assembly protein TadD